MLPIVFAKFWKYLQDKDGDKKGPPFQSSNGKTPSNPNSNKIVHPSQCEFARALYNFTGTVSTELNFQAGDLVAILDRTSDKNWWRGRLKNGATGYFPHNYVQILERAVKEE